MKEPLTVLLVEDDRIDQIAFQRRSSRSVCTTTTQSPVRLAKHGPSGKPALRRDRRRLQSERRHWLDLLPLRGDMPLIFVTGTGDERLAVEAIKAGAADYLTKDMSRNYLSLLPIVVQNAVKRRQTDKEAAELMHERIRRKTLQDFIRTASHDLITR
ncbi:MAG: hypothetical protein IPK19_04750 [Chloroflexi bacterium]|nr:hypothetical protein [Chloroflexota bacterium]